MGNASAGGLSLLPGYGALLGRLLFVVIFLGAAYSQVTGFAGTKGYMAAVMTGLPDGVLSVLLAGAIAFMTAGGLGVLLGLQTRWSALLLAVFLVIVTPIFHAFWAAPPEQAQMQLIEFQKNLAMLGGALLLLAFGPGPLSVDAWLQARRRASAQTGGAHHEFQRAAVYQDEG